MTSAETAYLFRHAVLRDAAYQLVTTSGRAQLHLLASELIEELRSAATNRCQLALCHLLTGQQGAKEEWQAAAKEVAGFGNKYLLESQLEAMREACAGAGVPPFEQ